ncbi:MAG TPA: hypothetical protein PKY96_06820 [Flavobacteriales bacterium]|nr:hypothetical protein [Flavobacteriales bacterium]
MRKHLFIVAAIAGTAGIAALLISFRPVARAGHAQADHKECCEAPKPKGCVFMTVYEGEGLDSSFVLATPAKVLQAEQRALQWLKPRMAATVRVRIPGRTSPTRMQ